MNKNSKCIRQDPDRIGRCGQIYLQYGLMPVTGSRSQNCYMIFEYFGENSCISSYNKLLW